jgi:hypothetical protein
MTTITRLRPQSQPVALEHVQRGEAQRQASVGSSQPIQKGIQEKQVRVISGMRSPRKVKPLQLGGRRAKTRVRFPPARIVWQLSHANTIQWWLIIKAVAIRGPEPAGASRRSPVDADARLAPAMVGVW